MKLKLRPPFPLLVMSLLLLGTPAFAWQRSGLSPTVGGYDHGDAPHGFGGVDGRIRGASDHGDRPGWGSDHADVPGLGSGYDQVRP